MKKVFAGLALVMALMVSVGALACDDVYWLGIGNKGGCEE